MGDDLMGISATAAAAREQVVLAHHPERLRETRIHDRPEAEPRPCGVPRPPRGMPLGLDGHQQSLVRDRGRSPALCWWALSGGLLPGSWRRTRNGQNPRPHRPAGGRRPNPCRERWRHSSPRPPRPKGPDVSVLASSSHLHDQLAIRERCQPPSPDRLRSLSEASIPAIAFSRHCSSRKISTPNCRDKSSTGSPRKSRRATSRLRVTVHRWPSPSGPAGETWPGENVDEPSSPSFTTGPSTATLFSKLSVMFRSSLDTSANSVSKEILSSITRPRARARRPWR